MKLLGIFFTACIALAAAQAVAVAFGIMLIAALIYGLIVAPRETVGVVGLILITGMFQSYPLIFLGVVAMMTVASILRRK